MSVASPNRAAQLKQFQTQLAACDGELSAATQELDALQAKIRSLDARRRSLREKIQSLSVKEIVVSEHAMLRYLERVHDVDMNLVRAAILPDAARELIQSLGDGTYPIGEGVKIRVKGNTVITVIGGDA